VQRARELGRLAGDVAGSAGDAVARRTPQPVRKVYGWFTGDEFFTTSSSLAFYALISLPPMTLIALWIAGVFVDADTLRDLGDEVSREAPDDVELGEIVAGLVETATTLGFLSVVAALWPATAYGAALAKGFGMVAPEPEREVRGWQGRLLSLALVATLPLVVFGAIAVTFVVPRMLGLEGVVFQALLVLSAAVVFFLVVLLVFVLFRVREETKTDLFLGACLATGAQAVLTVGYLLYLRFGADFEETYGASSLAVVVLLGLYLLFSNAVLLSSYRYVLRRCHRRLARQDAGTDDDGDEPADREAAPDRSPTRGGSARLKWTADRVDGCSGAATAAAG
jgi:uncharacterized BrkB/YihY/UPF0761 family membrane protein